MDFKITLFANHLIVMPISDRAVRFARRFGKGLTYQNGVVAASSRKQVIALRDFLLNTRMGWAKA